ncbi:MAG TPA: type 2 isopentenyl-diphosphate Delta-isomerase [Acholeplasmataceae bacterium]|nr:type 2 isopentenyl-diphosphate Delta-isomerase [Acholeplasmataceae bacterium]
MKISKRKDEHIKYALKEKEITNAFDQIKIDHISLPLFNFDDVNLETTFLGYKIPYPIYINAMTGGSKKAHKINLKLSLYAKKFNLPMVLGSQSAALKNADLIDTYKVVRKNNPDGIIVSNINLNYNSKDANKAIEMVFANAISIHLNPVQELVMKEGDRNFSEWENNLKDILLNVNKPILVKEVGFGMSESTIIRLKSLGVKYIDISGSGGTNFAKIERLRKKGKNTIFDNVGIETVEAIANAKEHYDEFYASGGIRNAHDIFKALYLGSSAVGLSKYFLSLTKLSNEKAFSKIEELINDLKKYFVLYGYKNLFEMKNRGK